MLGLGLGDDPGHEIDAGAAVGLYPDAGILRLEPFSELFVRASGQRRVPDDFAFGFGARDQALLAVQTGIGSQLRERGWLLGLRPANGVELEHHQ